MASRYKFKAAFVGLIAALLLCSAHSFGQSPVVDTGTVSGTGPRGYFGIPETSRYDISFKQASLREVLQFLAWIGDVNIILPQGLEGVVNISFRKVTIEGALNAIIRSNNLEYAVEGEVIRIGKVDQFADSGEDLKTETFPLRYAPAKDMAVKVKVLLSSRGSVIDDQRTNSITVRELPANIDKVRRFIADVDIKDAQVLIESKILEATRRFSQALGIQWGLSRGEDGSTFRFAGINAVGQGDAGRNLNVNMGVTTPTSGLLIGSVFGSTSLDLQILAAERRGDIYVISDPSIVTSNGKSANIRSGATLLLQGTGNVNIGTSGGTTASTGSGIEEKKTGVELTVTPQITIYDYVKLDIEAITSTPDFTRTVQGIPVIVDNTATTTVLVKDGETTVIGGLSRYQDGLNKDRVPYLSQIPLLGNLFKSKDRATENTELMVFIKPTIIRTEGKEPAQVRVREVEERQKAMFLEPILTPEKDVMKRGAKPDGRGNKYVR
ncbi:MAG: secretin N-terminal domain-containing protein [Pseudomonadota bacterium]